MAKNEEGQKVDSVECCSETDREFHFRPVPQSSRVSHISFYFYFKSVAPPAVKMYALPCLQHSRAHKIKYV